MIPERDPALRAKLAEDLDPADDSAAYLALAGELRAWSAPQPSARASERLVKQVIQAAHPGWDSAAGQSSGLAARLSASLPWLFLRGQARLIYREIWVGSLFVLLLGWLLTGLLAAQGSLLPIALIAPLVSAVGIAFIYGPDADHGAEIELATPVSPSWILLARLTLVFAYNLALGLVASALLVGFQAGPPFGALVSAWLAPMAFLSGLSFFVTVAFNNAGAGVTLSMGLWTLLNLLRYPGAGLLPSPAWVEQLFSAQGMPWLWAAAIGLVALGLWLARNEERWLRLYR